MEYAAARAQIDELRQQIAEAKGQIRALTDAVSPEAVEDYEFQTADGSVRLSELFDLGGEVRDTLMVVHNMGAECTYCTLWADGFNGLYDHLASRLSFIVSTPDSPRKQAEFAVSRGWRFPLVSHEGSSFAADMGYRKDDMWWPGVSVFQRRGDSVVRVSDTAFGPGDDFCALWNLLDLVPGGADGWQPDYRYA